jgi:putative ABC transport system permease protein
VSGVLFFHYVLRKLRRRLGNNALTVAVIGFVLAGCILGLAFLFGLRATARESLPADHVVVTSKGAIAEQMGGGLTRDVVHELEVLPGVRGISPEIVAQVLLDADTAATGIEEPQVIRGLPANGFELHGATIVEGRAPAPGAAELAIGDQLRRRHPKLHVGSTIRLPGEAWNVVGVFAANGSVYEGEAWGDAQRMATALKQERVNGVLLAAASPEDAATLVSTINDSKRFEATARNERDFRGSQAKLEQVTHVIAILVIALCVIGVFVTATNLHASLIARLPELVTLIALGVRRRRVARIMMLESLLLALIGAVLAVALALLVHGRSSSLFDAGAIFELRVGAIPLALAGGLAVLVGLLGGLVPALMVRRIDLVRGLR